MNESTTTNNNTKRPRAAVVDDLPSSVSGGGAIITTAYRHHSTSTANRRSPLLSPGKKRSRGGGIDDYEYGSATKTSSYSHLYSPLSADDGGGAFEQQTWSHYYDDDGTYKTIAPPPSPMPPLMSPPAKPATVSPGSYAGAYTNLQTRKDEGGKTRAAAAAAVGTGGGEVSAFPISYQKYRPATVADYFGNGINNGNPNNSNDNFLDVAFPRLSEWMFRGRTGRASIHLFQAGRKQNYGFMDDGFTAVYLPARPDCLANWLECLDVGVGIAPAGTTITATEEEEGGRNNGNGGGGGGGGVYAHYTWQSVVPLPDWLGSCERREQLRAKYGSNDRHGFRDAPNVGDRVMRDEIVREADLDGRMFPKVAALAGLRKDRRVLKGWISFNRQPGDDRWTLEICKSGTRDMPGKSRGPKGLAFEGEGQHIPAEEPLFRVSGSDEIWGLHDLFCVVEGLLRTL